MPTQSAQTINESVQSGEKLCSAEREIVIYITRLSAKDTKGHETVARKEIRPTAKMPNGFVIYTCAAW